MPNETLQKILQQKGITTDDQIIFQTIFDVLSTLFTDENHLSTLTSGYNINHYQQVWFPNIVPLQQKELAIKRGMQIICQMIELKFTILLITFAKLNEKKSALVIILLVFLLLLDFLIKIAKQWFIKKLKIVIILINNLKNHTFLVWFFKIDSYYFYLFLILIVVFLLILVSFF